MPKLEQLNCFMAKLVEPKQQVADKGLAAIRHYFNASKKEEEDDPNRIIDADADDKEVSSEDDKYNDQINKNEIVQKLSSKR